MTAAEKDRRDFGRRQSDLVLVELTQKIVENNNSVSTAVTLMGENIIELAESQERIENKIDDACTFVEELNSSVKSNAEDLSSLKKTVEASAKTLKALDELKVLDLIKNIKKLIIAVIFTAATSILWFILKDLIFFYIKSRL